MVVRPDGLWEPVSEVVAVIVPPEQKSQVILPTFYLDMVGCWRDRMEWLRPALFSSGH